MKSGLKVKRRRKNRVKSRGKNFKFFLLTRFYTGRRNATNKSCLFDAKFFEFEEFSIDPFFLGSIQPQHAVQYHKTTYLEGLIHRWSCERRHEHHSSWNALWHRNHHIWAGPVGEESALDPLDQPLLDEIDYEKYSLIAMILLAENNCRFEKSANFNHV